MLTTQNIESELSYAYLHAIASRAGFGCKYGTRHDDDAGVDAELRVNSRLGPSSDYARFTVDVQLKATTRAPIEQDGKLSYSLKLKNYDDLRSTNVFLPSLLVVLFLPEDAGHWLSQSEETLIARKCAYWVVLRGAPESENKTHQTVYLPRAQILSVVNLRALLTRYSIPQELREVRYEP